MAPSSWAEPRNLRWPALAVLQEAPGGGGIEEQASRLSMGVQKSLPGKTTWFSVMDHRLVSPPEYAPQNLTSGQNSGGLGPTRTSPSLMAQS